MDIVEFRNNIVRLLHNHIELPIISIPINYNIPSYPFIAYTILNSYVKDDTGHIIRVDELDDWIIENKVEQIQFLISFSVYGQDAYEIKQLAKECKDYFDYIGLHELSELGIVVVDSTNIENRDLLDVDEYERCEGFDITFRTSNVVERRTETINIYEVKER